MSEQQHFDVEETGGYDEAAGDEAVLGDLAWDIAPEDIPSPFNIFQSMQIDGHTGRMHFLKTTAEPGTYVEMRAEMDCLVAVSACPIAGLGKSIRVQVYQ